MNGLDNRIINLEAPLEFGSGYSPNKVYIIGKTKDNVIRHEWSTSGTDPYVLYCNCCGMDVDTQFIDNQSLLLSACYCGDRNAYYADGYVDA